MHESEEDWFVEKKVKTELVNTGSDTITWVV